MSRLQTLLDACKSLPTLPQQPTSAPAAVTDSVHASLDPMAWLSTFQLTCSYFRLRLRLAPNMLGLTHMSSPPPKFDVLLAMSDLILQTYSPTVAEHVWNASGGVEVGHQFVPTSPTQLSPPDISFQFTEGDVSLCSTVLHVASSQSNAATFASESFGESSPSRSRLVWVGPTLDSRQAPSMSSVGVIHRSQLICPAITFKQRSAPTAIQLTAIGDRKTTKWWYVRRLKPF
jgi:hypothetical protein